jgi:hypothetical protein
MRYMGRGLPLSLLMVLEEITYLGGSKSPIFPNTINVSFLIIGPLVEHRMSLNPKGEPLLQMI